MELLVFVQSHSDAALRCQHAQSAEDLADALTREAENLPNLVQGLAVLVHRGHYGLTFMVSGIGHAHI